jgi:hypothetical protein
VGITNSEFQRIARRSLEYCQPKRCPQLRFRIHRRPTFAVSRLANNAAIYPPGAGESILAPGELLTLTSITH